MTIGRCRDWGRDKAACVNWQRLFSLRRGRAVAIGATVSKFPAGFLRFPCRGPSAWCRRPLLLQRACEARGLAWSSRPAGAPLRVAGGVSCHAAGRFHRGGGLSFSLCSRSPWRARQKPLIDGPACNGAALHVFCVVSHVTHSGKRPAVSLSRRASFFQGVSHARR